ncbi:glycosyltransferase family 2 protein [Neobacillus vireti]|uniref:glycosyltransferase family 2 protein n=1 Tax=Neobacillus vireti TaxID=220686 RepID=UPI002FFDD5E9
MSNPVVSIIMGIYNNEKTLDESVESIINQTFHDWELIMCDDGSTDLTYKVAKYYSDKYPNVHLISNDVNKGLNYTLNHCLKYASGKYIARMDGDDISEPTRLEKEVAILESNEKISIVSSLMGYFNEKGEWSYNNMIEYPSKLTFIKGTPFCHAPCMVRREAYDAVNGYSVDKKLLRVEDYDLWFKMYSKGYRGYNIQEVLYKMRDDNSAIKRRKFKYRINETYVRIKGFKMLNLPLYYYPLAFKPILVGLLPTRLYVIMRRKRMDKLGEIDG